MGILFNSTALRIYFKTRLSGEICLCDVNMHKGTCLGLILTLGIKGAPLWAGIDCKTANMFAWVVNSCARGQKERSGTRVKMGSETRTRRSPTKPFWIVTCTFSDNLSGNSCIQCSRSPRNTSSSRFLSARQIAQNQKL